MEKTEVKNVYVYNQDDNNYEMLVRTKGKLKSFKIDADDFETVSPIRWHDNGSGYLINRFVEKGKRITLRLHRALMSPAPNEDVDHINRDVTDNRKSNLRICTHHDNCKNKSKSRGCTSRYKGVCYAKNRGKWISHIRVAEKLKYLGYYESEKAAAVAYDEAAIKYYGEFANPNFPTENKVRVG